jgi:hypothetical protein
MAYVIRTRDLDLDCTFTWQRAKGTKYLSSSFQPFTTVNSVYPTLKGATRQRDFIKRITRYAFCTITVEELT